MSHRIASTKSLLLVIFAAAASLCQAAITITGDGVASFDLGSQVGSGDISNNPNGPTITGQSGAWASITTTTPAATDNGVTLTFSLPGGGSPVSNTNWGGTAGDNRGTGSTDAIRIGTFLGGPTNIEWTISGLTAGEYYDMIWYNKRVSPGENRHPNTGVDGFDAGNGAGLAGPLDGDQDQNFIGVQANGSGEISGTWFLAGGTVDITAVSGVQITDSAVPEPSALMLGALGGLFLLRRRR